MMATTRIWVTGFDEGKRGSRTEGVLRRTELIVMIFNQVRLLRTECATCMISAIIKSR